MTNQWFVKKLSCPHCSKEFQMMELAFDANGNILVGGVCVVCNQIVTWESDIFRIVSECRNVEGIAIFDGNETVS